MTMNKTIYIYTKHQHQGASSRYRSIQYFDFLRQQGYSVIHRYLFSDAYLGLKYARNRRYLLVAVGCYLRRLLDLLRDVRKGHVFIIEKELFPYLPLNLERLIQAVGVRYILDFDDAIWHNYDANRRKIIRLLLGNKLQKIVKTADAFIGGNDYLCDYARHAGAKQVVMIPTVIPQSKYHDDYVRLPKNDRLTLVWIGSPSTSRYLLELNDPLQKLSDEFDLNVKLIGFDEQLAGQLRFRHSVVRWQAETEVGEMATAHIGMMPLPDGPFEKGKCGFKLIQYMAVGLPVLASPVGVNVQIVQNGVNGFTCQTGEEWYSRIRQLLLDENLRRAMGERSRAIFVDKYSLESASLTYLATIEQVRAGIT